MIYFYLKFDSIVCIILSFIIFFFAVIIPTKLAKYEFCSILLVIIKNLKFFQL